jgi:hypothetical protein
MRTVGVAIVTAILLCGGSAGVAEGGKAVEKKTVYAVAKVDGRTKKIDGKVHHLVALRLEPKVFLLGTGLGNPVLLVGGVAGRAALTDEDKERALEDNARRVRVLWLSLPDKGRIEVLWGGLSDPKEKDEVLRGRLVKAGYVPFRVDAQKLPVVKASDAKDLLAALDKLAVQAKQK